MSGLDAYTTALTLFAYALIFCASVALIATIVHVWSAWQERKFESGLDKLGRIDNPERFREEPYDYEAAMWTR